MKLTYGKRRKLRDLGWSVVQNRAKRPTAIPATDVLEVGEHVTLGEQTQEVLLVEVDGNR